MKTTEYAIVDIETTGGNASHSRIAEIAVNIFDGTKIVERFETLVNPQREIPPAIFALTGITNEMVSSAPVFDEIAEKIFEILNNRIFVAHNVNFDYSFVKHQLEQSGFKWTARKLCTVRASRKIRPGLPSYSLGNLCRSLDISLENRHRASGDCDATAILLSRLMEWDTEGEINKMLKKTANDQRLPPNLPPADFEQLPQTPGVYYFHDQTKKVIYVGKAINLKKRVASHFSGHKITPQRQNFLREIYSISFEICATELMALLLECTEIKKLWPAHNRALKRFEPKYGLFEYEARNGFRYLAIGKLGKFQTTLETFGNMFEAADLLRTLAQQFGIDHRFCKYGNQEENAFFVKSENALPDASHHNEKIANAIDFLQTNKLSFAVIDKGRSPDEQSCIWIENGHFYGMGYIASDVHVSEPSEVKDYITPYRGNPYMTHLIYSFAQKSPGKVLHQKPEHIVKSKMNAR